MAFLHLAPSGKFHVGFRFAGRQWKQSLNTTNPQLAERARLRLEVNLQLVEEGRLDVPDGVDVAEFLLYDGKLTFVSCSTPPSKSSHATIPTGPSESTGRQKPTADRADIAATFSSIPVEASNASYSNGQPGLIAMPLGEVFKAYVKQLPVGALAEGTLRVAQFHFDHLCEVLGRYTFCLDASVAKSSKTRSTYDKRTETRAEEGQNRRQGRHATNMRDRDSWRKSKWVSANAVPNRRENVPFSCLFLPRV